jgi:tetratricopeptide (TPR) repeat protein
VVIADKYGYIEDRIFRDLFKGKNPPRAAPPVESSTQEKQRYLIEHSGKPVYLTTKTQIPGLDTYEIVTWGLAFEAVRKGTKSEEDEHRKLWESIRFNPGQLDQPPGDFSQDLILSDYHFSRARFALLFKREEEGLRELRLAERHGFGIKEIHNNLGGALAEAGKAEWALPFLKNALAVDPDYDMAARNLANAFFSLKRYREGLPYFERLMELDPESPLAHLGKARALKELGQFVMAYFEYLPVLEKDPQSETLREEILQLAVSVFGKESALTRLVAEKPERPRSPEEEDPVMSPTADSPSLAATPPTAFPPDPLGDVPTLGQ